MGPAADMPPEVEVHAAVEEEDRVRGHETAASSPEIEVHAVMEAGILATDDAIHGTIDLARAQTVMHTDRYGGMLQVEAATGQVELLDLVAWIGNDRVSFRAGRFKTPLSMEFGIPAPKLILPTRALLVSAAPRRHTGAQLELSPSEHVDIHVGAFEDVGVRPVVATDIDLDDHLTLHVGATSWVGTVDERPTFDHEGDLGVEWHHAGTSLALEGLAAHAPHGATWHAGIAAMAAQRVPVGHTEVEPAVGWDSTDLDEGALVHRVTGAVNVHVEDFFALTRLSIEAVLPSKGGFEAEQVARAQVQVGF